MGFEIHDIVSVKSDLSGIGLEKTGNGIEEGGLSSPVGSDDSQDLFFF